MSAPREPNSPGVPDVDGIIALIQQEFLGDSFQSAALSQALSVSNDKRYQAAFQFLLGRRGQHAANEIVRRAVLMARDPKGAIFAPFAVSNLAAAEDLWRLLDFDVPGWILSPGTEYLGKLISSYPDRFGKSVLTTNFDPLIQVAIQKAGGHYFRTVLHSDGNLSQTEGDGCHVIHLHGYWHGSDTLHTMRQLGQSRPRLKASLAALLRNKLVVICAYGGWDDAFTEALMEVVRDDSAYPEVLWTFFPRNPTLSEHFSSRIEPGLGRGRISLYSDINCHDFLPKLYNRWVELEQPASPLGKPMHTNSVHVSIELQEQIETTSSKSKILEGEEADRPPFVEICVGRERDLQMIRESSSKVVFLTGIGGQGKSTLAARYFADSQSRKRFALYVWRDCKEESERFESQLAAVTAKLAGGRTAASDLAKESAASIVTLLMKQIADVPVLFVFDNADHYIDLESSTLIGSADIFVKALLDSSSESKVVFTCRPSVTYSHDLVLSHRLEGLTLSATMELFSERRASSNGEEIKSAHELTEGHAFWLDLLAIQVAKRASDLRVLVNELRSGRGPVPEKTLSSVWNSLKSREQTLLRILAETVRPVTEGELGDYLRHELSYAKVLKALGALKNLNLVVVKRSPGMPDVLELHPLVKQFILHRFSRIERSRFIEAIRKVYSLFTGRHREEISPNSPLSVLEYWTQSAELAVAAGNFDEAFITLAEVCEAFLSSASPREFSRVARLLLSSVDWVRENHRFKMFESVFSAYIRHSSYLGEYSECDDLLDRYESTIRHKDSKYINYCEMRSFTYWTRGELSRSIEWGKKGQQLKEASGVDTGYDVSHTLALAERDAGRPEVALPVFLEGRLISEVLDPQKIGEETSGAFYGNIGRCLQFMGQIDGALICYQKSALLIEQNVESEHVLNQGFVRAWIAEVLAAQQLFELAYVFFRAAYLKWEQVSPPKAATVELLGNQIKSKLDPTDISSDSDVERICLAWILGKKFARSEASK